MSEPKPLYGPEALAAIPEVCECGGKCVATSHGNEAYSDAFRRYSCGLELYCDGDFDFYRDDGTAHYHNLAALRERERDVLAIVTQEASSLLQYDNWLLDEVTYFEISLPSGCLSLAYAIADYCLSHGHTVEEWPELEETRMTKQPEKCPNCGGEIYATTIENGYARCRDCTFLASPMAWSAILGLTHERDAGLARIVELEEHVKTLEAALELAGLQIEVLQAPPPTFTTTTAGDSAPAVKSPSEPNQLGEYPLCCAMGCPHVAMFMVWPADKLGVHSFTNVCSEHLADFCVGDCRVVDLTDEPSAPADRLHEIERAAVEAFVEWLENENDGAFGRIWMPGAMGKYFAELNKPGAIEKEELK